MACRVTVHALYMFTIYDLQAKRGTLSLRLLLNLPLCLDSCYLTVLMLARHSLDYGLVIQAVAKGPLVRHSLGEGCFTPLRLL